MRQHARKIHRTCKDALPSRSPQSILGKKGLSLSLFYPLSLFFSLPIFPPVSLSMFLCASPSLFLNQFLFCLLYVPLSSLSFFFLSLLSTPHSFYLPLPLHSSRNILLWVWGRLEQRLDQQLEQQSILQLICCLQPVTRRLQPVTRRLQLPSHCLQPVRSQRVPPCAVKTCAVRPIFCTGGRGAAGTTSKQMSKGPRNKMLARKGQSEAGGSRGRSSTQEQKTRTVSTCCINPGGLSLNIRAPHQGNSWAVVSGSPRSFMLNTNNSCSCLAVRAPNNRSLQAFRVRNLKKSQKGFLSGSAEKPPKIPHEVTNTPQILKMSVLGLWGLFLETFLQTHPTKDPC